MIVTGMNRYKSYSLLSKNQTIIQEIEVAETGNLILDLISIILIKKHIILLISDIFE